MKQKTHGPRMVGNSSTSLAAALIFAATCFSGCVESPVASEDEYDDESEEIYSDPGEEKLLQGVQDDRLWKTKTITYCFVTPTLSRMPSSVRKVVSSESQLLARWRNRIQEFVWAINQTWQSVGVIDLRSQEACGDGMVRVTYNDDTPTGGWAGLGRVDALASGIHMDSEYLGDRYPTGLRTNYHTYIAAHEFGHTLGFEHEQNRSDSTCKDSQDFSGAGIRLTGYDPNSVMNYCNSQRTELTALDRAGFKKAYAFLDTGGGTTGGTTGDPACRDSNSSCSVWARNGECSKNPGYMLTNCCASCKNDGGGSCHTVPANDSNYCTDSCRCNENEGDCDSNAQCATGLLCQEQGSVDRCVKAPTDGGNCHTVPANDSNYCTSSCTCKEGEGDCDSNAQCASGLVCQEQGSVDRCVKASTGGSCNKPVVNVGNGGTGYGECEGDCDSDSDCRSGLRCVQLSAGASVPGCTGRSADGNDYCVVPACL